jgi:hypothetical protein
VSNPTTVVGGSGGPACTRDGLQSALDKGGVVTFACGGTASAPFTIAITSALTVDQKKVVVDGGDSVILDGGGSSRILRMGNTDFTDAVTNVTVQRLAFAHGHTTDVANTMSTDQGGAAIYRIGGALTVIGCSFSGNVGPVSGQDVAGGAIYSIGGGATVIEESTFDGNACSNGGALGNLGNLDLTLVNVSLTNNQATGTGANPGNGGNGGAISFDGSPSTGDCTSGFTGATAKTINMCGVVMSGNVAGAFGGAVFRTVDSYGCAAPKQTAPGSFDRVVVDGNTAVSAGGMYLHQVDVTMIASTISRNATTKGAGGGLWLEGASGATATLSLTNVTIAGNTAGEGLGGGVNFGSDVAGSFTQVSLVQNKVTTASGNQYAVFAGGTFGDPSAVTLTNSIVADNDRPAATSGNSFNCETPFMDGGGNLQHVAHAGGSETQKCAAGVIIADPKLGALMLNAGPSTMGLALETVAVGAGSAAIGLGHANCAAVDERGAMRGTPCTSGAYEAD